MPENQGADQPEPNGAKKIENETAQNDGSSPDPNNSSEASKPRFYHIDWMRTIAVHLVAYIHALNVAEELRLVNYPNFQFDEPENYKVAWERMDGARRVLLQMGIPMFFYISGFAVTFFNTEKKNFKTYFCDKFKRLIIPLVVVVFVFLIPRNYLD